MTNAFIIMLALAILAQCPLKADVPKSVSAKDFGAVGDGVADDTAAINAALESVAGRGIVHLPAGAYVLSDSLIVPGGVTLMGEGARWQTSVTRLIIPTNGFPGVRLGHGSGVKALGIIYPNNRDNANPEPYPPGIQLEGINPSVENIVFDSAWIGISTAPGGRNSGQAMFKEISGFVHHIGIHLSGTKDVNRIQDVHWFVGGQDTAGKESYYKQHRVGFQFGNVDGIIIDRCFMILGKTFFHQLPLADTPDGSEARAHSLGFAIDNCWIEHVDHGFIFEGYSGFTISNTNILIDGGGAGIIVDSESLFYNAVISGVQVRGHSGPFRGIDYNVRQSHPRNRLAISNVQITDGAPGIRLRSGAQRAQIQNSHIAAASGHPAILIDEGADLFTITNNIFNIADAIEDNSGPDAKKTITGNLVEN